MEKKLISWPNNMSTAERRAFQQICDPEGKIFVIALDQRNGMRQLATSDKDLQEKINSRDMNFIKNQEIMEIYLSNMII